MHIPGFSTTSTTPIMGVELTEQQLFDSVNLVLPAWILLVLLPRWRFTQGFASLTAVAFCLMYTAIALTNLTKADNQFAFSDMFHLEGVKRVLASPEMALPAWLHYVAFDLFTAKWQVQDSITRNMPHLLLVPCLALTFLMGPVGLLTYFLVRTIASAVRSKDRSSGKRD